MKKVIATIFILLFTNGMTQDPVIIKAPVVTNDTSNTEVNKKIKETVEIINQDIETIKKEKQTLEKEIKKSKELKQREASLITTILKKLNNPKKSVVVSSKERQLPSHLGVSSSDKERFFVVDSTCTKYDRNFFGVRICTEWKETFREIKDR